MPANPEVLGVLIRRERKARGLSQEGLAALAGLSRAYVGEIERGEANVSFATLIAIADGLNLSVGNLISDYELRQKSDGSD